MGAPGSPSGKRAMSPDTAMTAEDLLRTTNTDEKRAEGGAPAERGG